MMEKLIKHANGQWTLVSEPLQKTPWVKDERESTPAKKLAETHPALGTGMFGTGAGSPPTDHAARSKNSGALKDMFREYDDSKIAHDHNKMQHHVDRIKNFISSAPEGHIDIGHLRELKQKHMSSGHPNRLTDDDILNAANKHVDAKSLKEVHDKYGIKTVRALAGAHGIISNPYHHENSSTGALTPFHEPGREKLKPLIGDVQAYVNGVYGQHKVLDPDSNPTYHNDFYESDYGSGSAHPDAHKHQEKVDDTFVDMIEGGDGATREHEDAVLDRGEHAFKHAHKVKD